jgi:hypothetical protein
MSDPSLAVFMQQLRQSRLLDSDRLGLVVRDLLPRSGDAVVLARKLVRRGWLTPSQAEELLRGCGLTLRSEAAQPQGAPWGWVAAIGLLALAAVVGLVLWLNRDQAPPDGAKDDKVASAST